MNNLPRFWFTLALSLAMLLPAANVEPVRAAAQYGYLWSLFFDFEHIRYPSDKEEDKVEEINLFCIMKGKKDCKLKE